MVDNHGNKFVRSTLNGATKYCERSDDVLRTERRRLQRILDCAERRFLLIIVDFFIGFLQKM